MKVTMQEIIVALENHGVTNTAKRIREHGIQLDYVPMTDDELVAIWWLDSKAGITETLHQIEQAVLNRLGVAPCKHRTWGAGEVDCPADIKASNGEIHTRQCKVCGERNFKEDSLCQCVTPKMDFADAYAGAREDLLVCQRDLIAAEKLNQNLLNELGVESPTFMGEPVVKESLITELDQAKAICEQAGFAVVPSESTSHMDICAMERHDISKSLAAEIWATMLEAAKEVK
jgi:hypothetical protein